MTGKRNVKTVSVELVEDMEYQKMEWLFERVGWVLMTLIILGALLGFFGKGILNTTHTVAEDFTLSYDTYARKDAPTTLTISLKNGDEFFVDHTFLSSYNIESIHPEPQDVQFANGKIIYTFSSSQKTQDKIIVFRLQPNKIGFLSTIITSGRKGGKTLNQVVYP